MPVPADPTPERPGEAENATTGPPGAFLEADIPEAPAGLVEAGLWDRAHWRPGDPSPEELEAWQSSSRGRSPEAMLARGQLAGYRQTLEARRAEAAGVVARPPTVLPPVHAGCYAGNQKLPATPRDPRPEPDEAFSLAMIIAAVEAVAEAAGSDNPLAFNAACETFAARLAGRWRDTEPRTLTHYREAAESLSPDLLRQRVREAEDRSKRNPPRWLSSQFGGDLRALRERRQRKKNASPGLVLAATPARRTKRTDPFPEP